MSKFGYILMKIFRKIILPKYFILLYLSFIATSCIKTDLSDCVTFSLNVKALDAKSEDITTSGEAGDVHLYIFDSNMRYLDERVIASDDVVKSKVLNFQYRSEGGTLWVVAWSNLNGSQQVKPSTFSGSTSMNDALVKLSRNSSGYAVNPDDLFYGAILVNGQCNDYTVEMNRKTALMDITVVGLPNDPFLSNYSFVIRGAKEDVFDFTGTLVGDSIDYRQVGEFITAKAATVSNNISNNISTTKPFKVYPLSPGNRFTVEIYNGRELIGVADKDSEGNAIIPRRGLTNNILLDFSRPGEGLRPSLEVTIKVTDWNDVYQWVMW